MAATHVLDPPMQALPRMRVPRGILHMPVATVVTVQNILKLFSVAETGAHTQGALARRGARRVRGRAQGALSP